MLVAIDWLQHPQHTQDKWLTMNGWMLLLLSMVVISEEGLSNIYSCQQLIVAIIVVN